MKQDSPLLKVKYSTNYDFVKTSEQKISGFSSSLIFMEFAGLREREILFGGIAVGQTGENGA
jgi:hypothetical protein